MKTIRMKEHTGAFAEDKDVARTIRISEIEPALAGRGKVVVDFTGVPLTTQSFVHAMLSVTIRSGGAGVLDRLEFKGCSAAVKTLVQLVSEYSQETDADRERDVSSRTAVVGGLSKTKAKTKSRKKK